MSDQIHDHYKSLFKKHGDGIQTAQYSSKESQYLRFKYLTEIANIRESTILDYGCGLGHLYNFLKEPLVIVSSLRKNLAG